MILYPTYSQNTQTGNKYYNINNPGSYTIHGVPFQYRDRASHIIYLFTTYIRALSHRDILEVCPKAKRGYLGDSFFLKPLQELGMEFKLSAHVNQKRPDVEK